MQQDRDIGFLCHSPYTNSEEPAQSQYRVHAHRLMRGHAPQVQKCTESEPVYGVLSRYVQQDHDIGFLCHSPYTNSEEPAQSQYRRSRAPSGA